MACTPNWHERTRGGATECPTSTNLQIFVSWPTRSCDSLTGLIDTVPWKSDITFLFEYIMISALTVIENNNSRFFPYKWIRNQIWPCHKVGQGQPRFIICANLVGPTSPMLRPLAVWFQRRRYMYLKGFYHIWAWWPLWSCDQYNWYKFWLTYHKETSYKIWAQLA